MSNLSGLGKRLPFTSLPDRPQRLLKAYPHLTALYVELARRCGPRASVRVRQSVLAAELGCDERTVRRHTKALKDLGLIEVRRTRRTAYTWLPDHRHYARDIEAYRNRAAAHMEGTHPQAAHMDRTPAHMDRTPDRTRPDTDVLSRQDTDVLSIDLDVLDLDVPSSRRPEGQAASDDGTRTAPAAAVHRDDGRQPPPWSNARADQLAPLATVVAHVVQQMHPDDPTRPLDAPDWDVHEDCGWTFRHPKHQPCIEARTA